jgi:hypothetical protein
MTVREHLDSFYGGAILELVRAAAKNNKIGRALTGYSCPFAPYVGEAYEREAVRLLIVGKATYGWDEGDCRNLEDFARHCEASGCVPTGFRKWSPEFVVNKVQPYYGGQDAPHPYHSLFWQRIYVLGSAILERSNQLNHAQSKERGGRCFRGIAWTNVFKIGGASGNPDPAMRRFLCEGDFRGLLKEELDILRPDIVLFSTGPSYDDFLGDMGLHVAEATDNIALVTNLGSKGVGFRSFHFQYGRFNPSALLDRVLMALPNSATAA